MKDLGDANHILGMRITQDHKKGLLYLSQKEYVHKVLERFNMQKGKSLSTPLPAYLKLNKDDCPKSDEEKAQMAKILYASACGSLMYAMVAMRPDIAYAVGVVSRYMSNPGKKHWDAIKSILRYLSGTVDRQLCYGRGELSIEGYVDSDYAGCVDNRRSTTGWIYKFSGFAISWRSVLQDCTSVSAIEAEYVAASEACNYAMAVENYPLRDMLIVIMMAVWIIVDQQLDGSTSFMVLPFLGDQFFKIVRQSPLQRQSMLRLVRLAKKLYGLLF